MEGVMMLDPLIVKYIKLQADIELSEKDENFLNKTWDALSFVFALWKRQHGNRDAKYKTPIRGVYDLRSENKIKSFDEAAPWDCAGLEIPSPMGLAFKLHKEKYPAFLDVMKVVSPATIYALLINRQTEPCGDRELFYGFAVLAEQKRKTTLDSIMRKIDQSQAPLVLAGQKQLENLAKGRSIAGKKKSERAAGYHETWKKWAREAWENGPKWWNGSRILDEVCSLVEQHGHKMVNGRAYSRSTIRDVIAGIKKDLKSKN